MVSRLGNIDEFTPRILPTVESEMLCPAFGYSHSSTTMKVMKFAEYIPIIGMIVGAVHLAWSVKKWSEGASGAGSHILRALVALTNVGFVLAFEDLMEEISLEHDRGERLNPSLADAGKFMLLDPSERSLDECLTALNMAEKEKNLVKIEYHKKRIRSAAEAILDIDVQHPSLQEGIQRIKAKAMDALQRIGDR